MRPVHARLALALAIVTFAVSVAHAAAGDYRLVTGTLVWPHVLMEQSVAVVQGDDGVRYFAEIASPGGLPRVKAGDRVAVLGRLGSEPAQLTSATVTPAPPTLTHDATRDAPSASPAMTSPAPAMPSPGTVLLEGPAEAIFGTVDSVSGSMLTVDENGHRKVTVDVSRIDESLRQSLVPGQAVRILAAKATGRLVAEGVIVEHRVAPAASPAR